MTAHCSSGRASDLHPNVETVFAAEQKILAKIAPAVYRLDRWRFINLAAAKNIATAMQQLQSPPHNTVQSLPQCENR